MVKTLPLLHSLFATVLSACAIASAFTAPASAASQKMAVPAYFVPGGLWTQMEAAVPGVGLAILNPDSGPGASKDTQWVTQTAQAQAAGLIVIGYVHTSYASRPLAQVKREASEYYHWYHVNGIFFDEVSNTDDKLPYYKHCLAYARSLDSTATVVINPGTQTTEGYMSVCDVVCTFESDYSEYEFGYSAPPWVKKYPPNRFWHIVLNVPTNAEMLKVVAQTKQRRAGWVFVTSLTTPNPYDNLPQDPYWSDELRALSAD